MSKDLKNSEVNGYKEMRDGSGKDLLEKLKLYDIFDRREVKINVRFTQVEDGELIRFMHRMNWIYIRPWEYCVIGDGRHCDDNDRLHYYVWLPAAACISVIHGSKFISFEVGGSEFTSIPLTGKMLQRLDNDFPDQVRNIELVHELDSRFSEYPAEAKRMLQIDEETTRMSNEEANKRNIEAKIRKIRKGHVQGLSVIERLK